MLKPRFCYRVSEKARLAVNGEGNPAQLGLKVEWLECISQEEFDLNHADEEWSE